MSLYLLDANALIALTTKDHVSHAGVMHWMAETKPAFATCPITEGALVRFHMRLAPQSGLALSRAILQSLAKLPAHRFWPDDLPYLEMPTRGVQGYRQVTDSYLVALARKNGAKLATLDQALAAWHFGDCLLIA